MDLKKYIMLIYMKVFNKPISNVELEHIIKVNHNINNFDCIMKNQFVYKPNWFYIINLESKGNLGTHWVCVITTDDDCFYFDSFGCIPPMFIKHELLKHHKSGIKYNAFIIQNLKSSMCGYFCLGLILYVVNSNKPFTQAYTNYIHMFEDDTKKNNNIIVHYLNQF